MVYDSLFAHFIVIYYVLLQCYQFYLPDPVSNIIDIFVRTSFCLFLIVYSDSSVCCLAASIRFHQVLTFQA